MNRNKEKIATVIKTCPTCGKDFESYKSENRIYCDISCYNNKKLDYYLEKHNGYIIKYNRGKKRRKFLHVEVVEKVLGRPLRKGECVHHINMIKTDNRRGNLLVCTHSYHRWLHDRYAKRFAELCLR